MPYDIWPSPGLFASRINILLMTFVLFAVAIGTSTLLLRCLPPIRRILADVEAGRHTTIDGLRGLLAIGVFIHHTVIT